MTYYKVIDIPFEIKGMGLFNSWTDFVSNEEKTAFRIEILPSVWGVHDIEQFQCMNDAYLFRHYTEVMMVSQDWKEAVILPPLVMESVEALLMQMYYVHAAFQQMIQVHSSLVDFQGKGILFLGPSGIGKTTQAELWHQYAGAHIINGDRVYVKEEADLFYGCGTPWHGSSPYCLNQRVPIVCLVVLKQAKENHIRKLSGFEKVAAVSGNVFYPQWVKGGTDAVLDTLGRLLEKIPVYELSCLPNQGAVMLLKQEISS